MAEAAPPQRPLDELMLAMDVVDTLRHRQGLVERELNVEQRDRQLIERLREIYASQGIEVSDAVLRQGLQALKEERFAYSPPPASLQVRLARVYVSRDRWGKPLLAIVGLLAAIVVSYVAFVRWPAQRRLAALPTELQAAAESVQAVADSAEIGAQAEQLAAEGAQAARRGDRAAAEQSLDRLQDLRRETAEQSKLIEQLEATERAIAAVSQVPEATAEAERLAAAGAQAARRGDRPAAEEPLARLKQLQAELEQEYELRIVSRPGERTGVIRSPDLNPSAENYYIIVEPVDPGGQALSVPVTSEEDGATRSLRIWGQRVEKDVYDRVAADKKDDGIVQDRIFGYKRRGQLKPEYRLPAAGGAIHQW